MKELIRLGNIYGFTGGSYAGNVYSHRGLCPAINTAGGGNREPIVIIKEINYEVNQTNNMRVERT